MDEHLGYTMDAPSSDTDPPQQALDHSPATNVWAQIRSPSPFANAATRNLIIMLTMPLINVPNH